MDLIDELNCGWFVPAIFKIWGVNMYRKFDIIGISIPKRRMNIFKAQFIILMDSKYT